jgi:HEAT repeat protein
VTTFAVRQYAIRYIGELKDAASLDELIRIYDADKTKEIRSQVLRALAEREDPRARAKLFEIARRANAGVAHRSDSSSRRSRRMAIDDLLQLYTSETNLQIKQGLLRALPTAAIRAHVAKLLESLAATIRSSCAAMPFGSWAKRRRADRRPTRCDVRR